MYSFFDNVGRRLENGIDIRARCNVYASTLQGNDREQKGIKLKSLVDASWFSQFFGDTSIRFKFHSVANRTRVLYFKERKLVS